MNIRKYIPNAVAKPASRALLHGQKYSPQILFGVGVVSMGAALAFTVRGTLKVGEVVEKHNEGEALIQKGLKIVSEKGYSGKPYSEADAKKDRTLLWAQTCVGFLKIYAPALIATGISVASFGGAQKILNARNTALLGAFKLTQETLDKYRDRVREELGEDKEFNLFHDLEAKEIKEKDEDGKDVTKTVLSPKSGPSQYARYFDEANVNWDRHDPAINRLFIHAQQNYLNDLLIARGHVFLNEAYDALGMERSTAGAVVGWTRGGDGDGFIDFGVFDSNNIAKRLFVNGEEPSILLDFNVEGVIYDKIDWRKKGK